VIDAAAHRYKGTSPFQDSEVDRKTFFGRDRELRDLENLLLAEDLVVLFARSGMGKSSLINAGLMKSLRLRGFFPVVARANAQREDLWPSVLDAVRGAARDAGVDCVKDDGADAWDFFKRAELWSETDDMLRPVLILDQFEELFTLQSPARRREFIRQLAELIRGRVAADADSGDRSPPRLKLLLSLREDFLAELEELSEEIPTILRNRFRLGALSREGARDAIIEPARVDDDAFDSVPFSYREEAVAQIIAFLGKRRLGQRTIEVDEVEPVQLQLICQYVEDQVRERQSAREGDVEVSDEDLQGEAHMRKVLETFYERTVEAIGSRSQIRAVRRLCEKRLISPTGRRWMEDEEEIVQRFKIPKSRLRQLVDARLLRAEPRLGGTFYELSHDTLVAPILQSRAKRLARTRNALVTAGIAIVAVIAAWWVFSRTMNHTTGASGGLKWQPSPQLLAVLFREPPSADDPALETLEDVALGRRALNQDSHPGAVTSLQRLLVLLGYSTGADGGYVVDGSFSFGTVRGVAQFQVEHGIGGPALREVLVRNAGRTYDGSGADTVEAGLRGVEVDEETLNLMFLSATSAIDEGRIPFGELDDALSYLNALSDDQEDVFDPPRIVEAYGRAVDAALEAAASDGRRAEIRPAWVLTFIDAQSGGFPSSVFDQTMLAELYRERPRADFAELRYLATSMGLGRVPGTRYDQVGAGSPREMLFASAEDQVAYAVRFLASMPRLASIAAKATPAPDDFLRFVGLVLALDPGRDLDVEVVASKFRTFRGREEAATELATAINQAVGEYRRGRPTQGPATLGEALLPILSMSGSEYAEDFQRILAGRVTDPSQLGQATVRAVQRLLIFLGYSTDSGGGYAIDGVFGPGVNRGLAQFRHEHALADLAAELTQTARKNLDSIPAQPLDSRTLKAMLSAAEAALAQEAVPYGGRRAALFLLNSLEQRKTLAAEELFDRYFEAAAKAEAETGTRVEWTLAFIKQETGGVPRPTFAQHLLSAAYDRSPDVDFAELRLRATAMGVGRLAGSSHAEFGAATAKAMFMARLDEQVLYVARFLAFKKEVVSKAEPSADDFREMARFYVGLGYEARNYDVALERWFRELRALRESRSDDKGPRGSREIMLRDVLPDDKGPRRGIRDNTG
jgi:peptidoglycan hydrolase-like protein with peptidoglycan-binding domain